MLEWQRRVKLEGEKEECVHELQSNICRRGLCKTRVLRPDHTIGAQQTQCADKRTLNLNLICKSHRKRRSNKAKSREKGKKGSTQLPTSRAFCSLSCSIVKLLRLRPHAQFRYPSNRQVDQLTRVRIDMWVKGLDLRAVWQVEDQTEESAWD